MSEEEKKKIKKIIVKWWNNLDANLTDLLKELGLE